MLEEIIKEADELGNGEIAFQEFKKLMLLMQKQGINEFMYQQNIYSESVS